MANTTTYNTTRELLVRGALRKLGVSNPGSVEISNANEALNEALRELDIEGKWNWAIEMSESTITLSSNVRTYAAAATPASNQIPADILDLEYFWLLKGTNYVPVSIISQADAQKTYERESTGEPIFVYLEEGTTAAGNTLHVLPTPNGTYTGKFTYQRLLYDANASGSALDIPPQGIRSLKIILAADLADEHGAKDRDTWLIRRDAAVRKLRKMNFKKQASRPPQVEYY